MPSTPGNSLNITSAGIVKFDGTSAYTGVTTTNHNVLIGSTSNGITNLTPGAASTIMRSGGASADPGWTTNFQVSASDVMTNTSQPNFLARASSNATNATGDGTAVTVACDTVIVDQASNYNNSTYTFTAPVAGRYCFYGAFNISNIGASHTKGYFQIVTSTYTAMLLEFNPNAIKDGGTSAVMYANSAFINMAANDTATLQITVFNSTKTITVVGAALASNPCLFGGFLVC